MTNETNEPVGEVLPGGLQAILYGPQQPGAKVFASPVAAPADRWPVSNPWAAAVDDARVALGLDCTIEASDPVASLRELVDLAVDMALDPRISQRAAVLAAGELPGNVVRDARRWRLWAGDPVRFTWDASTLLEQQAPGTPEAIRWVRVLTMPRPVPSGGPETPEAAAIEHLERFLDSQISPTAPEEETSPAVQKAIARFHAERRRLAVVDMAQEVFANKLHPLEMARRVEELYPAPLVSYGAHQTAAGQWRANLSIPSDPQPIEQVPFCKDPD